MYSNIYARMTVDDSKKLLDVQEKYAGQMNKLFHNSKGMLKSVAAKRIEVAGKPAIEQETTFDFTNVPGTAESRAMMEQMFGGSRMLVYSVAADEHTMLMGIGVSQERMAAALDVLKQPRKSLAEDGDVSVTAAMLPAKSQWVFFLSPHGYLLLTQKGIDAATKNNPGSGGFKLPQFPRCAPIGFAVKAAPDEIDVAVALPSALLQAAGEYAREMQTMFMQGPNQPPAP